MMIKMPYKELETKSRSLKKIYIWFFHWIYMGSEDKRRNKHLHAYSSDSVNVDKFETKLKISKILQKKYFKRL